MKKVIIIACIALCAVFLCGGREDKEAPEELPVIIAEPVAVSYPWDGASKIENCTVTYYCCEKREHICGTGDGYTATGTEVTPWQSCAVDPLLIPLGSRVWVDFGDGAMHELFAEDVGGAVNGAHIDIAVETHQEALDCGRDYATVYWK